MWVSALHSRFKLPSIVVGLKIWESRIGLDGLEVLGLKVSDSVPIAMIRA